MMEPLHRRDWLRWVAASAAGASALTACKPVEPALADLPGGFTGVALERGHSLRPFWQRLAQGLELPAPAAVHRAPVVIAGGGMAGLAAARALELAGVGALFCSIPRRQWAATVRADSSKA